MRVNEALAGVSRLSSRGWQLRLSPLRLHLARFGDIGRGEREI
jgi:hypothetical protein